MATRSPEFIQHWLDGNLYRMDGPSQYLGDEPGSVGKPWSSASVRWLLTASWPYEQASGNMSIPAVYRSVNDGRADYLCDRFYLPATSRDLGLLERGGIPVFGIESKHQLRDFDVVGTSISYTVLFMNFCKLLSISGMPLRWKDRQRSSGDYPMVMVGGQAFCAPEFMSPVADCVWLGEVEDEPGNSGIAQVCERIAELKFDSLWQDDRELCYTKLALEFNYLYFPRFTKFSYGYEDRGLPHPSKQVVSHRPLLEGMRYPHRARKVKNIDKMAPLVEVPLLYSDPGMGAGDVEASRGCPAWCTFCRLSWVTKPYRQHSVSYTVEQARQWRLNMGSLEISPFGPDFPMHTEKKALLSSLLENVSDEVDTSSMRVDDFIADPDYSMLMAVGGTDSITLGLEGNSQRMRDLAGKGTSDDDVAEAVTRAIRAGIRKIKLYMISNWPGEEPGDVMRIVDLGRRLAGIRDSFGENAKGVRIQFSWTPLLIEAQTPLQWFAPTPPDYTLQEALNMLRDLHIDMKIGDLDYREPVLTPDRGFVPIGQLKVGDLVVDPQGEPSKVTGVFPRGENQTYRVTWSDGTSVLATGNHPWDVLPARSSNYQTVTTWRLKQWLEEGRTGGRAPALVQSPGLAGQNLGPDIPLVIPPYLLGLLLGDGCFTKNVPLFSTADPELVPLVETMLPPGVRLVYDCTGKGGKVVSYRLAQEDGGGNFYPRRANPVTEELRRLGLWKHYAWEKFVPEEYKWTSPTARLAILQGLLDTDGTVSRGKAYLTSSSEKLRDDVAWLARSLGMVATTNELASWYPLEDGSRKECRTAYGVSVWGEPEFPLFRLARKVASQDSPRRRLVSVEPEGRAQTVCISVSAASEEYIAGAGLVPTHNTKAAPEKLAFFQVCQRASRDAGEAIVDVIEELGTASWGGFAKDMKHRLDIALERHGFHNGLDDLFGERTRADMFGWEHIDTGVSADLMWDAYQHMVEFLEGTDAATYDESFDEQYHGNEWVARCDTSCQGSKCGACDHEDLRLRTSYIRAASRERDLDLEPVTPLDQTTVSFRLRIQLHTTREHRFVTNEHWKFAIRRAAYRAAEDLDAKGTIAKRSIRLASDALRYRDRSVGVDYTDFGLTRRLANYDECTWFVENMRSELAPWLTLGDWSVMGKDAKLPPRPPSLWELEVRESESALAAALRGWDCLEKVPVLLRSESFYAGVTTEEGDAKKHVSDLWVIQDGSRLLLRMVLAGKLGPYQTYAALMSKASWIEAAAQTAERKDFFLPEDYAQGSVVSPVCQGCGRVIPSSLLGQVFDWNYCPRCKDGAAGLIVSGLLHAGV